MWTFPREPLDARTTAYGAADADGLLSRARVLQLWRDDPSFRDAYLQLLRDAAPEAYFWEHPPLTADTLDQSYGFILAEAPGLARPTDDPRPFAARFHAAPTATFNNLGGDAVLVVPCPDGTPTRYAHLAAFVRTAPPAAAHALLQAAAQAVHDRLSTRPLWLSTSGLGVSWLHLRLDDRPKYYTHRPYRQAI